MSPIPQSNLRPADETEHMAFQHGFIPLWTKQTTDHQNPKNNKSEQGPWVYIHTTGDLKYGEVWERTGPKSGKRVNNPNSTQYDFPKTS